MNLKKIGAFVIPTIIAVAIIAYMLYSIRDDLFVAIDHAVPAYLIIAVLICFFSWILRGLRYKYILEKLSVEITLFKSIACIFISQTANMIIPARLGDLLRLFIIKHESDATYSNGLSSIVAE
ncbi:MAG: flippase-like domain-containing protein, partial [Methanomicrobium sp.]|nr:flippase-like domain-containing protein [Methanomicrobium sp.]